MTLRVRLPTGEPGIAGTPSPFLAPGVVESQRRCGQDLSWAPLTVPSVSSSHWRENLDSTSFHFRCRAIGYDPAVSGRPPRQRLRGRQRP